MSGGALHLHDGGGGGDLDVESVMSGSWRETRGGEVLKLVVVDGSLNLPSLDEGMASILYPFACSLFILKVWYLVAVDVPPKPPKTRPEDSHDHVLN